MRASMACAAILTIASVIVAGASRTILGRVLWTEWYLWLTLAQLLGMGTILVRCGSPRSVNGWLILGLLNLILFGISALCFFHMCSQVLVPSLRIVLRCSVTASWLFALVGLVPVVRWIGRLRRGARRSFPLAKWWFSTVLLLLLIEPIAAILDRRSEQMLFPGDLPSHATDEIHVAAIGGSTMLGYPYQPKFSIPAVIGLRLRMLYPQSRVVVHNLAEEGLNLRLAASRLDQLTSRPDLLLVYTGHNEFYHDLEELTITVESPFYTWDRCLAYSPTFRALDYRLSQRMAMRRLQSGHERRLVDEQICGPLLYQRRLARFRSQLEQLAAFCRRQGIATLWFVPVSSESTYEPNRSVPRCHTSLREARELEQRYERVRSLQEEGQWREAADLLRQLLENQPEFAEFHFRLAECLFHLGEIRQAREHFAMALEADGHPVRANRDFREQVREVAQRSGIPLVESERVLRPETESGILDSSVFHDDVHPQLRPFFLLAMAAVDAIVESQLLEHRFGVPQSAPPLAFSRVIDQLGFGYQDLALAYSRIAAGKLWHGRLRFDDERRARESAQYERWAQGLRIGTIRPGASGTESLGQFPSR